MSIFNCIQLFRVPSSYQRFARDLFLLAELLVDFDSRVSFAFKKTRFSQNMLGAPEMFQCVPHIVVYLSQTLLVTRFVFADFNIRCIEDNLC